MQKASRMNEILETIVCPACHGRLLAEGNAVRCTGCGNTYPIKDGIPVLLVSRARSKKQSGQ